MHTQKKMAKWMVLLLSIAMIASLAFALPAFAADPEDTVLTIESADGLFEDVELTMEQLLDYETTEEGYTRTSGSGPVTYETVTGITLEDLLEHFIPYGSYTSEVRMVAGDGFFSAFAPTNADHASAMLLWSAVDASTGDETLKGTLRSALDGGGGSFWTSNVVKLIVTQNLLLGDVNGDDTVNLQDVLLIYQNYRSIYDFTAIRFEVAANVNKDAAIDMADVLLVYSYFRGKISSFDLDIA